MRTLHIDLETYSSMDVTKVGAYRYAEDVEIILFQYAFDDEPVTVVDVLSGEPIPREVEEAIDDETILKMAQNANFERTVLRAYGFECEPEQWKCTAVWAASLGLPRSLGKLTEVLKLGDKGKLATGRALIRKFCMPCKPTKKNGQRTRNLPEHFPEDWLEFKQYGRNDVEAERELERRFSPYPMLDSEWALWCQDQRINDRGVYVDMKLVRQAILLSDTIYSELFDEAQALTNLDNPNSRTQLISWLASEDHVVETLRKEDVNNMLSWTTNDNVRRLLQLRQQMARSSVKKFEAVARSICKDGRIRGMLLFNGAGTGRWAGNLVQLQNLPSKGLIGTKAIGPAAELLKDSLEGSRLVFEDIAQMLSSLIRPMLRAPDGKLLVVADYSAIEGRIVAWLAHEQWRIKLFQEGGKLYETSAEMMFGLSKGSVKKGNPMRDKGKVSELALGYQGWTGALITMGALKMGLTEEELPDIASAWRRANPAIEAWWYACEEAAIKAVQSKQKVWVKTKYQKEKIVAYSCDGKFLMCHLPSGRKLYYPQPRVAVNSRGRKAVNFMGIDGTSKQWKRQWTYGGHLTENQAQAIARDALATGMMRIEEEIPEAPLLFHVHDENINEADADKAEEIKDKVEEIMGRSLPWWPELLLKGEGYVTPYYVKED